MFLIAHHILASTRLNAEIHAIMHEFYTSVLFTVQGRNYTVSQAIGGPFTIAGEPHDHPNWIRDRIEAIFNPIINRTLVQRPTLARMCTNQPIWNNMNDVNPYDIMFGYTQSNEVKLINLLSSVSTFVEKCDPNSPTLGALLQHTTGIVITSLSCVQCGVSW